MKSVFVRLLSVMFALSLFGSSLQFSLITKTLAADDSITIVQVQFALTNDANGNNIANIGDQVSVFAAVNNTDGGCVAQGTQVTVDLTAFGGGMTDALNCATDNGGLGDQFGLQHIITDAAGSGIDVGANNAASQVTVTATDADENDGAGNPNPQQSSNPLGDGVVDVAATGGVDTIAPQVTDGNITATQTVDNGTAAIAGVGDVIRVTYDPSSDGNSDPNPNQVIADLSAIGGNANQQLFDDGSNGDQTNGDGIFTFDITIAEGAGGGIDATGLQVAVAMEDDAGNNSGAAVADSNTFSVDNVSPTVSDVALDSAITTDAGTLGVAEVGDVIRTTWDNSGAGDNNTDTLGTITADLSAFGGGASQQLFDDGSNGDQTGSDGVFTYDLTITAGAINANNLNTSITVTDDAGNQTVTADTSSNLAVDSTSTATGGGGVRRIRDARIEATEEEVGDLKSCGCHESFVEYQALAAKLADALLDYPSFSQCLNPGCLKNTGTVGVDESVEEREFRLALENRLQVAKQLREAGLSGTAETLKKAQEAYEQANTEYHELQDRLGNKLSQESKEAIIRQILNTGDSVQGCYDPFCPTNFGQLLPEQVRALLIEYETLQMEFQECAAACPEELPGGEQPMTVDPSEFEQGLHFPLSSEKSVDSEQDEGETDAPFQFGAGVAESYASDIVQSPQRDFIVDLYQRKVVSGINNGDTFAPKKLLNRAEMLKIVFEAFGIQSLGDLISKPFPDVGRQQWFAQYFDVAKRRGIIKGYPDGTAKPGQEVNRIEALTMIARAASANLNEASDHQPSYRDFDESQWWAPVARWADMYGITDGTIDDQLDPDEKITREEMAEITSMAIEMSTEGPCDCDTERQAWEAAEAKYITAARQAEQAQKMVQEARAKADQGRKAVDEQQQKVDDLRAFFDDSSSITDSDTGEKITKGDLLLLEAANQAAFGAYLAGELSAQEVEEKWKETDKDALEKLREEKKQELEKAEAKLDEMKKKQQEMEEMAEKYEREAEGLKRRAEQLRKRADELKKAYEDCVEKCEEENKQWAEMLRRQAEERRRRLKKWKEEQERKAREAEAALTTGGSEGPTATTGGGGGAPPAASKDPCKEKFLQAIAARGKQIAETRPDDVPETPPAVKTAGDIATTVGDLIANAASAAAQGGSTAVSIANALTALPMDFGSTMSARPSRMLEHELSTIGVSATTSNTARKGFVVM